MKASLLLKKRCLLVLMFLLSSLGVARAQTSPIIDGSIGPSEYGTADNQQTNNFAWYMTWDANYIYIAVTGKTTDPGVVFLDTKPNEGLLLGKRYSFTGAGAVNIVPPFPADHLIVFDNSAATLYITSSANGGEWSNNGSFLTTTEDATVKYGVKVSGQTSTRELRIARSTFGLATDPVKPFNWLGYVLYDPNNPNVIGQGCVPKENPSGYKPATDDTRYAHYYYTIPDMASAKPFQYLSASYPTTTETATSIDQGTLSLYDFTVNNPNLTVRNAGGWTVSNNLSIQAGKVDMGASANNVSIGKNFTVSPGAKFLHSSSNSNLSVGGDFNADANTFVANQGTVTLTGNGSQKLGGGTFYKLSIPGTGTKTLQGNLTINSSLTLTGGVMETGDYKVVLNTTANNALTETGTGYVRGTVEASGTLDSPNDFTFAGIGVTISPKSQSEAPGKTTVTRYTGKFYTGKAYGPDYTALSQSILRQYKVNTEKTSGIQFKMIFSYRDNTPNELVYPGYSIDENTMELFRSSTPQLGGPWQDLHATSIDPVANKVTVVNIRNMTQNDVFTLAGRGRPLPVTLTKFVVAAVPAGVRLNWATAMEEHDVEFVVERTANSNASWQQVGRVKGKGSTTVGAEYSYLDAGLSAGRWYYRLRQLDSKSTSATETVTAVVPVVVEAAATSLQVSPVPARNEVTISGLKAGQQLQVIDGLGRQVLAHTAAASAATLPLDHLPNGLYIIRALGGESVQTLRFIKE